MKTLKELLTGKVEEAVRIHSVPREYYERVMQPEKKKIDLAEFIRRVLESDYLLHLPHRPNSLSYLSASAVMWRIMQHRLAAEGRLFIADPDYILNVQRLLAWGCQLIGTVQSKHGTFEADLTLRKGIWLYGLPGVGKTFLTECFTVAMAACGQIHRAFRFVNMKQLEQQLRSERDAGILEPYGRGRWILDDVGFEGRSNLYGNQVEPFEVIINERYQRYKRDGLLTIVTSNYPIEAPDGQDVIAELYDKRLSRRVREMFTQVHLRGEDKSCAP